MALPLNQIVSKPSYGEELLSCGHTILPPLNSRDSQIGQRRRCYKCGDKPRIQAPKLRGAPQIDRAVCPHCGKKGLGNIYSAHNIGNYRQCTYCSETVAA